MLSCLHSRTLVGFVVQAQSCVDVRLFQLGEVLQRIFKNFRSDVAHLKVRVGVGGKLRWGEGGEREREREKGRVRSQQPNKIQTTRTFAS